MKSLILTVTLLNFMIHFPYNGSQEIYNQTNGHFSANSPLSSSDSHTASQISSILRTKRNAVPTEDANSYSGSTDTLTRLSGFLPERNHSKTLQGSLYEFSPFEDDAPRNSSASQTPVSLAYVKGTVDNSTQTGDPISNASLSSAAMQGTSAVSTTISSFAPNPRITLRRVVLSGENSISAPVFMTTHQYKSDSTAVPQFQINSKAIQSPEPFFPSTGSSKPFFASNPVAYIQNPKNDFTASKEDNIIITSNTKSLLGTDSTTQEKETGPDSIFFTDTTAPVAESNTEKIDVTDILEGYATPLDVPDLEDNSPITTDTTYLERYSKTVSNAPELPMIDNSIVIDATDIRNYGRATVNAYTPGISFAKKSNDFASVPTLSSYGDAEAKTIKIATDINEAMSNNNLIATKNYFLTDRMHKKSSKVVSNSTNTKTMIDVAKSAVQVEDLNIPQTKRIISTKHYANPNPVELSRDDGTRFIVDASKFMKSIAPFDQPQATNAVKKTSLADIIMPKSFQDKAAPVTWTLAATTASQGDVDTMFYIPKYESENSFTEDIILNYEEDPPKKVGTKAEEDTLQENNDNHYNYITSIASENVPRDRNLIAKFYSISPDAYESTRFKGTIKTTADQFGFGNPAPSYIAEVSNPLLGKLTPKFQEKRILRNSNSGADDTAFFVGDDILYLYKENVPKVYTTASERESTITIPNFRIPTRDNMNPALKDTTLLGKEMFSKNHASDTDEQIDLGTKKDQTATGSITNSHAGIIPVTSFTSVSSEDINMEDYSHISRTSTPLSLGYTNKLVDDSIIVRPQATIVKENNLDNMDLIITRPDESGSKYISSKYAFELQNEGNSSIKKTTPFTQRPTEFISHTPSSNTEITRSLLYRKIHPEVETKEKYQTITLKEENSDSNINATTFKYYTKNIDSQHPRIMTAFPIDAGETFSSGSVGILSSGLDTVRADDVFMKLPEVYYDLGSREVKSPLESDIIINLEGSKTFRAGSPDRAVFTTPIKSQGHFYRKGVSFNAYSTTAPKLADPNTSEKPKINGGKMDSTEITLLEDHINPLARKNAPQVDNNSYSNDINNTGSTASLYLVNAIKMPPNAITISPNDHVFASKKSKENDGFTMPEEDGALSMNSKYLLIHNQKRPRTAVALSENDDSLSDTSVTSEVSGPLGEHTANIDQNWEIANMQTVLQPFSMVSSVPLADPTTLSKNPISATIERAMAENGDIDDKAETMSFSPKIALQPRIHRKEKINEISEYDISRYVNQAVIPSTEEITPLETQANTFLGKDKAVKTGPYISEMSIPVNLREVKTVKVNPFIRKPDVTSAEWKVLGNSKEAFYPDSTMNTKLTTAGTIVKPREFPSLSTSAKLIPIAISRNPETSDLTRYNSLSQSSPAGSEVLEIITENADAINGGDVPERQILMTQTDIQSYPLAWNDPLTRSTTFTENPTDGEVDLVLSLNREPPDNYKTKTDKIYSRHQRAMMKAFSPREDSQNSVYVKRKIADLSDPGNPTPEFVLSHLSDVTTLIPTMEKIHPLAAEPNTLSKSYNNVKDKVHFSEAGNSFSKDASTSKSKPFPVKLDAVFAKPQAPPNLKGIFSGDFTLTLPKASQTNDKSFASLDKVTSTGESITNTVTGIYGLPWKSTLPPSAFTTPVGTPKYYELVPVSMEKETTTRIGKNIPPEETVTPFDQFIILPSALASGKDMVSTFNENIFGHENFRERERDDEYEIIYFTGDNSERVDDISSADKLIPAYMNYITIMTDDSGSDYVSGEDAFESEKEASNSLIKMSTFIYAPKTQGSFGPYNAAAASDNLPKIKPSEFKTKENHRTIIPRQEHKNFDTEATALKDSTAHVNSKAHRPTTYSLIDASENFLPSFPDKTSMGKSTINGDDVSRIPYEVSNFRNKISRYFIVPDTETIIESKISTTDATNHAVKNRGSFFRKNMSPMIYNTITPIIADTTTSTTSEFAKDENDRAVVSDSRFNTFPSTQLLDDGISSVAESRKGVINTALTSFSPLKKMSAFALNAPAISTKDKNYFGHSSLPLSENIMPLRSTSMGQPEILILDANAPTKETVAHRLEKGASLYHPPVLTLAAEPVSAYSAYFSEGVGPEGQNAKSQMDPRALPLVYTVPQIGSSGSSDKITDVELNTFATIASEDNIYGIDVSGGLNSEPKKTSKFSTVLLDKYNVPLFYHIWEITKPSAVKDTATGFEVNHLTDVSKVTGDGSVIKMDINSARDADLKPFLVNKNVIAGSKSINKDYDSVPTATYSSFPIHKVSLPARSITQRANFMAGASNLPMGAITIIPTDEKSSSDTEIVSLVEGNSQLGFDAANLRAANNEFQALESTDVTHKSFVEKILPKFQEFSIVPQNNKEIGEDTFFKAGIPQLQTETITPKDIPGEPTDKKADMTDPALNAFSLRNKKIVTQQATTPFNYNLLSLVPNIPITGGEGDKAVDFDVTKPQNVIAPLASFTTSEGRIFFLNEDIGPETSSQQFHSGDDYNHLN